MRGAGVETTLGIRAATYSFPHTRLYEAKMTLHGCELFTTNQSKLSASVGPGEGLEAGRPAAIKVRRECMVSVKAARRVNMLSIHLNARCALFSLFRKHLL